MSLSRRHFISGCASLSLLGAPAFNARAAGLQKEKPCHHHVARRDGWSDGYSAK